MAGGNKRSGALKRVRSRIRYARSIGALEPATRRTLETAPFFEWALRQKDWEELNNVRGLTKGVVAFVEGRKQKPKSAYQRLLTQSRYVRGASREYLLAIRELREAELEIERLAENKDLSAKLATKAEKSRQASEHGKKGAGIPREKKDFT